MTKIYKIWTLRKEWESLEGKQFRGGWAAGDQSFSFFLQSLLFVSPSNPLLYFFLLTIINTAGEPQILS